MKPPLHSLLLLAILAGPALAEPSPPNVSVPACISLVGSLGSTPAAIGQFTVICRDLANNPLVGAAVVIDLSNAPELTLCADQLDPAAAVDCVRKTVTKTTAADGSVNFDVLGGSTGQDFSTGLPVGRCDYDCSDTVGANDLSLWLGVFGSGAMTQSCTSRCP